MARVDYDLVIIGGGSGGLTAAKVAASLGARTLLVDKVELGGDCLRHGCVPSKSLLHVARLVKQAKEVSSFGLTFAEPQIDMAKVSSYIQGVIQQIEQAEQAYVKDVTVKFGCVAFRSPTLLQVDDEEISFRACIIATGSRPRVPDMPGLQEVGFLTNEEVFDLLALPASFIIAGAGPAGTELSQALRRLGAQVTLLQKAEHILPREDPELSETLTDLLQSEGVQVVTGARMSRVHRDGNKKVVMATQGGQERQYEAEELLIAVGRQPNLEDLNLEAAGVAYTEKGITVDEHLQTTTPHILAIGDVIGNYLFTHVASYQAGIAVRNALLPVGKKKVDYRVVPWCTFTDPEAARVGLTPQQAEEQHKQVRTVTLPWHEIDRAQTEHATTGFIKLVLAGKKDEIVGVHMLGSRAGELLGEMTLALQHQLSLNDLFGTIHAYPTLHTGLQQVAFEAYLSGNEAASNRKLVQTLLQFRG